MIKFNKNNISLNYFGDKNIISKKDNLFKVNNNSNNNFNLKNLKSKFEDKN